MNFISYLARIYTRSLSRNTSPYDIFAEPCAARVCRLRGIHHALDCQHQNGSDAGSKLIVGDLHSPRLPVERYRFSIDLLQRTVSVAADS